MRDLSFPIIFNNAHTYIDVSDFFSNLVNDSYELMQDKKEHYDKWDSEKNHTCSYLFTSYAALTNWHPAEYA